MEKSSIIRQQNISTPSEELMKQKKEVLEETKLILRNLFGIEKVSKEVLIKLVGLRKMIAVEIDEKKYLETLPEQIKNQIAEAVISITRERKEKPVKEENITEDGSVLIEATDIQKFTEEEKTLFDSLERYYQSYAITRSAYVFRQDVEGTIDSMSKDAESRKLNLYSAGERADEFMERFAPQYEAAGFTREELSQLLTLCPVDDLSKLEIKDIKTWAKIKDVFSKYLNGDKSKYIALSAALTIPAMMQGYAPHLLSEAFKSSTDLYTLCQYALLTATSAGLSYKLQQEFKRFMDENFAKEKGFSNKTTESLSELPSQEIGSFGAETVKQRISYAKDGYQNVLRTISADIVPAMIMLSTSAAVLYNQSPELAAGTVAGSGLIIGLDKLVQKYGKFWQKESKAEKQREKSAVKLDELLSAHMEIILSNEKEKFREELKELADASQVASSDKSLLQELQNSIQESFGAVNFIIAGLTSIIAGGSPDKFIAALVYSGNFRQGVSTLLRSHRRLLSSLRDIQQMDLMFNGYAAEEEAAEKNRVGISEVLNHDIKLNDVSLRFEDKDILKNITLEIPEGTTAALTGISGSGKTSLMKIISGYYKPSEGAINVGETPVENIKKSGPDSLFSGIAYLPQFPYIRSASIRDNIRFGVQGEVTDDEINEVLKEVSLTKRFKNLSEMLEGGRGDSGTLSGGEALRVGMARTLLKIKKNNSRIVFLDEPTASVDKKTSQDIAGVLNSVRVANRSTTFIVISHDKEFLKTLNCDQVIAMEESELAKTE